MPKVPTSCFAERGKHDIEPRMPHTVPAVAARGWDAVRLHRCMARPTRPTACLPTRTSFLLARPVAGQRPDPGELIPGGLAPASFSQMTCLDESLILHGIAPGLGGAPSVHGDLAIRGARPVAPRAARLETPRWVGLQAARREMGDRPSRTPRDVECTSGVWMNVGCSAARPHLPKP